MECTYSGGMLRLSEASGARWWSLGELGLLGLRLSCLKGRVMGVPAYIVMLGGLDEGWMIGL